MNNKSLIEILYNEYENDTGIKLFIEALSIGSGFPITTVISTLVGNKVKQMTESRIKSFFDELNSGEIELNETLIENQDFLHSYFSVLDYVARSKSNEKSARFARIIKNLYLNNISLNQFEDYTSIFNELSEREFAILCIKYDFERKATPDEAIIGLEKPRNPFQKTQEYWTEFTKEVEQKLEIELNELTAILFRLQRTGCYMIHSGYFDVKNDGCGDTTVIFDKIFKIIKE